MSTCFIRSQVILSFPNILFIKGKDGKDDVPDDISFDNQVFDLSFYPNRDVIAAGEIDGRVTV